MNLADRAMQFVGQGIREVAGPSSHTQILKWLTRTEHLYPTDLKLDDSTYAWCGVFVGCMVLDEIAFGGAISPPPSYFQGARRWEKWGKEVPFTQVQRGDVIVLSRGNNQRHVTICQKAGKLALDCVGGNQSDSVCVQTYPFSKVTAIRRGN